MSMDTSQRNKSIIEETVKSQDYQNGFQQLMAQHTNPIQNALQQQPEVYNMLLNETKKERENNQNYQNNQQESQSDEEKNQKIDINKNQILINKDDKINQKETNNKIIQNNSDISMQQKNISDKPSLDNNNKTNGIQLQKQRSFQGSFSQNNSFKLRKQSINQGGLEHSLLKSYSSINKIQSNDTLLKRTSSQTSMNGSAHKNSGVKESLTSKLMNFRNQNNFNSPRDINSPLKTPGLKSAVNKKITVLKLPEQKKEEETNGSNMEIENNNINKQIIFPSNFQNQKLEEESLDTSFKYNFNQNQQQFQQQQQQQPQIPFNQQNILNNNDQQMDQFQIFFQMMQYQQIINQQQQQQTQQQIQNESQDNQIPDVMKQMNFNNNIINEENTSENSEDNQKDDIPNRRWTQEEHSKYLEFYNKYPDLMLNADMKKSKKAYKLMSKFIKTRNPTQCRTHDQKFSSLQKSSNNIQNNTIHLKQQVKSHNQQNILNDNYSTMNEIHQKELLLQQMNQMNQYGNLTLSQQQVYQMVDNLLNNIIEQSQSLYNRMQNLNQLADLI